MDNLPSFHASSRVTVPVWIRQPQSLKSLRNSIYFSVGIAIIAGGWLVFHPGWFTILLFGANVGAASVSISRNLARASRLGVDAASEIIRTALEEHTDCVRLKFE